MPRPTNKNRQNYAEEKRQKKNAKIKLKAQERGKAQSRVSQSKILKVLGYRILTYTALKQEAMQQGMSDKTFKNNFNRLREKEEIIKVRVEGKKHFSYIRAIIKPYESLEFFAIKLLAKSIREGDSPEAFNGHLGSFITYTLRHHCDFEAIHIINTVLSEVQGYIKPPKQEDDQRLLICGVPAITYNMESPQWSIWKAIDSRDYVTTVQMEGENKVVNRETFDDCRFEKDWLSVKDS